MSVNGKAKGSEFERQVSKILNELFDMKDAFTRSAGSGARFGGKNSIKLNRHNRHSSKNSLGDISTPDSVNLLVECKSYNSLSFHQILQPLGCKVLDSWLQQINKDKETFYQVFKEHLPILLVFKINRAGTYFVIPKKQIIKAFIHPTIRNSVPKREYIYCDETYLILQSEELFIPIISKQFILSTK